MDATSILIAFTRTGDANLDSLVGDEDVTILGALYPTPDAGWSSGDFEYNGAVDDGDVTLLGALYDPSAMPFPAAAPAVETLAAPPNHLRRSPVDRLAIADAFFAEYANDIGRKHKHRMPTI